MRKLLLFILLLITGLTYGQTKKNKIKTKEVVTKSKLKSNTNLVKEIEISPVGDSPTIQQEDENIIYSTAGIEVQPEFPGGNLKLFSFISTNFQYNDDMKENELKGRCIASFIIEKDGSISNIKILRSLGFGTEKEILRVLKSMPKWLPAEKNGKKVRCSYMLPIAIYATK